MNRIGATSSLPAGHVPATTQASGSSRETAPPLRFDNKSQALNHVKARNFPDKAQAHYYLEQVEHLVRITELEKDIKQKEDQKGIDGINPDKDSVLRLKKDLDAINPDKDSVLRLKKDLDAINPDKASVLRLKEALSDKIKELPELKFTDDAAGDAAADAYVRQHYTTLDALKDFGETLIFTPHYYDINIQSARQLAKASLKLHEKLSMPAQLNRPPLSHFSGNQQVLSEDGGSTPRHVHTLIHPAHRSLVRSLLSGENVRNRSPVSPRTMNAALTAIRDEGLTAREAAERFNSQDGL